ncbi:MAG: helix-turn-helix domain-containing protein [Fimbriimonadales bacterium]|nr:helix-turn-helix domain-containing protein [Fimbriimonadales bacterium]
MLPPESETCEWKEQWTDDALRDLAAFANHKGGALYLGVRDDGTLVGAPAHDAELQRLANLITSRLGVNPSIEVQTHAGVSLIVIRVAPVQGVIGYQGRYLRRVGSTNRDLTPHELTRRFLQQSGRSWDSLPSEWGLNEVDHERLEWFVAHARTRLPHADATNPERLLRNLELLEGDRLTNAGILLFGVRPQRYFPQAQLRIGVFRSPTDIIDSHEFRGTLWEQLEGAITRFQQVLKVRYEIRVDAPTLEGLQRRDIWEYPLEALREAVINALIHRDYTSMMDIQIRIYDDRLEIANAGELPPGLTPESLYGPHASLPQNPLLARAFYYAGYIERWGTGTTRIVELCHNQGLPTPEFRATPYMQVIFFKDPYTPQHLRQQGLNERQIKAVEYVKAHGSITNSQYQSLTGVSKATATRDLEQLVERGLLVKIGITGRGTAYRLRPPNGSNGS